MDNALESFKSVYQRMVDERRKLQEQLDLLLAHIKTLDTDMRGLQAYFRKTEKAFNVDPDDGEALSIKARTIKCKRCPTRFETNHPRALYCPRCRKIVHR